MGSGRMGIGIGAVWALTSAGPARAQEPAGPSTRFDGQVFRPSADSEVTIWTEDAHTAPDGYASARAYAQYARAPVRWRGDDGESERLVSDLLGLDVTGAVRWRSLRLGAHVPLYLAAGGATGDTEPGLGDMAFDLKGTVLAREDSPIGVGVAIMGRLALPTASVDVPLGASGTSWELLAIADRELGPLTVAANVGTRGVPRAEYEDLVWDDQLLVRFGGGWRWTEDLGASVELAAQTNWASGVNPAGTAVELMGGGWAWLDDAIVARGGLSFGLTRSPGAPVLRLVAGVGWEPDPRPDRDHDGIVNRLDRCPEEPEDIDGFSDEDGCEDRSYATELRLIGRRGAAVDGTVVLDADGPGGAEPITLPPGERIVSLHAGTYTARITADGYRPWSGPLEIAPRQGERLEIPLAAEDGELRVFAVDASGRPIASARVAVSGADPVRADRALTVEPGSHAIVVSADGYTAATLTATVEGGVLSELPVVLAPATPPAPAIP